MGHWGPWAYSFLPVFCQLLPHAPLPSLAELLQVPHLKPGHSHLQAWLLLLCLPLPTHQPRPCWPCHFLSPDCSSPRPLVCLHSSVHRDAPRHDGADRRGRGDGLLLPRQRLALLLPGDPVVVRAEPQGLDRQAGVGLEPGTTPGETPSWAGRFPTPGRGVSLPLISSEGYGLQYVCPLRHPAVSLPSP